MFFFYDFLFETRNLLSYPFSVEYSISSNLVSGNCLFWQGNSQGKTHNAICILLTWSTRLNYPVIKKNFQIKHSPCLMQFDLYQVGVQLNEYFGFNEEAS